MPWTSLTSSPRFRWAITARSTIEQGIDRIRHGLAKFFHQIKDLRGLPWPIDMQEAGERLQPRVEHRAPHLGIQDPIAIIEQGIDRIRRSPVLPTEELHPLADDRAHPLPVQPASQP